jgi:hypothetical protein
MKKILIPVLFIFLLACDDDDAPSKTELLTNNSSKNWNITADSSDDEEVDPGCKVEGAMNMDNTWTFYSDGKFIYDHGEVTEAEGCGDLKNLTGTWSFLEDEKKLRIFFLYNTDDPTDVLNSEFFSANLIEISADKFVLELDGEQATFTPK